VPAPRSVAPSKKCTEPARLVPVGAVTVAVRVTLSVWPEPAAAPLGGLADSAVWVFTPGEVIGYGRAARGEPSEGGGSEAAGGAVRSGRVLTDIVASRVAAL